MRCAAWYASWTNTRESHFGRTTNTSPRKRIVNPSAPTSGSSTVLRQPSSSCAQVSLCSFGDGSNPSNVFGSKKSFFSSAFVPQHTTTERRSTFDSHTLTNGFISPPST